MIPFDATTVMLGLGAGLVAGGMYFAGLAAGVRLALRSDAMVALLTLSAALRIAALLTVGWAVLSMAGPGAALGYAAGFLSARLIATRIARVPKSAAPNTAAPKPAEGAP